MAQNLNQAVLNVEAGHQVQQHLDNPNIDAVVAGASFYVVGPHVAVFERLEERVKSFLRDEIALKSQIENALKALDNQLHKLAPAIGVCTHMVLTWAKNEEKGHPKFAKETGLMAVAGVGLSVAFIVVVVYGAWKYIKKYVDVKSQSDFLLAGHLGAAADMRAFSATVERVSSANLHLHLHDERTPKRRLEETYLNGLGLCDHEGYNEGIKSKFIWAALLNFVTLVGAVVPYVGVGQLLEHYLKKFVTSKINKAN